MYQTVSLTAVGPYGEAYASMMPPLHALGSKTASRCVAPQPVLTPYTLREMARGQIANENRITAGTFPKITCWERLYFPYRQPMSRYRRTMFADTDCGILYRVNCISLYVLPIKHAPPPLCFLQRPPCCLWYDGDVHASSDRAAGREERGWTLSRWWIKRLRCCASGAA
jgi:hypothetical protein